MKGFGIYVKNALLEDKHRNAMGEAVWLYLWLLDRMTGIEGNVGTVLHGKPINYEDLAKTFPTLNARTYRRWMQRLTKAGYITRTRTPYGMIIKVHKAEKIFNSRSTPKTDKNGTSVRTKMSYLSDKNGTSNKDNTVNNTLDHRPNASRSPLQLPHQKEKALLAVLNETCGRAFQVVPKSAKATAKQFAAEQVRAALTKLAKDPWHKERLGELSSTYLLNAETIDRFVAAAEPKKKPGWM